MRVGDSTSNSRLPQPNSQAEWKRAAGALALYQPELVPGQTTFCPVLQRHFGDGLRLPTRP